MSLLFRLSVRARRRLVFGVLILLLALAALLPLPQSINSPCKVESIAVWELKRDGAGIISAGWRRNPLGRSGEATIRQFDRPEYADLKIASDKFEGSRVRIGDTICVIRSYTDVSQLKELEAQRDKAAAELLALKSGSSEAERKVAQQKIQRAKTALDAEAIEYRRVQGLYQTGSASLSEWEAAKGRHAYLQASLDLAEAEYQALLAGAPRTEIAVAEAELKRIQQRIEGVQNSISQCEIITSPLDGILHLSERTDEFASVEKVDSVAVVITIPEVIAANEIVGHPVTFKLYADPLTVRGGSIAAVDFRGNKGNGVSAVVIAANPDGGLRRGMSGSASIPIGSMTMREALALKLLGLRLSMFDTGVISPGAVD